MKKSDNIILESDVYISINILTLLVDSKDSNLIIFLNDFDLIVYTFEVFGIMNLIDTWVFIVLSRLQK